MGAPLDDAAVGEDEDLIGADRIVDTRCDTMIEVRFLMTPSQPLEDLFLRVRVNG